MKTDASKKIRRGARPGPVWAVIGIVAACLLGSGLIPHRAAAQDDLAVAVFDFDLRSEWPDPLACFIADKLHRISPGIRVDHYTGQGDEARAIRTLREIETKGYDLAIVRTSDALIIAQHTLFKTPTLYTNVNNPLLLGFQTLGPPGGNISGVSYYIPIERRLRAYKAIMPTLKKPGLIFDRHNKSRKVEIPEAREACKALGLVFAPEFIEDAGQLQQAVGALLARGAEAVIATSSGQIYENLRLVIDDTNKAGVPVFSFYKTGVTEGAVAALSSDFFRMAEELLLPMAEKVLLEKVSPGSLPAAFLDKNILFVNRPQAGRMGLSIPPELEQAHDVVYIN